MNGFMRTAHDLLTEMVRQQLPRFTEDRIFFCGLVGGDHRRFRLEVYRPNNYTRVYLRRMRRDGKWSLPKLYANHDSGWTYGIEKILAETAPAGLDSSAPFGLDSVPQDYGKAR